MTTTLSAPSATLRRWLALATTAAALGGCALSPRVDHQLGDSLRLAQAQQTMYPQARYNRNPVSGLDAQAAKSVYDNYQRSYAQPEAQQNGLTVGVGR